MRRSTLALALLLPSLVGCSDDDDMAPPLDAAVPEDAVVEPRDAAAPVDAVIEPRDSAIDAARVHDAGAPPPPCMLERTTHDQPDDTDEAQVHLLYVVPSDGVDRSLDLDGTLERTTASWQRWLEGEIGGARIRLDTCDGALDVTFVRVPLTDASLRPRGVFVRDELERALRALGFDHPRKIYLAYYDGTTLDASCGLAPGAPSHRSNVVTVHLRGEFSAPGVPPCGANPIAEVGAPPGYIELVAVHEVFHGIGAVPACAPHASSAHVGDDPRDLMYAGAAPWAPSIVDVDRDDYFGHGRADCYDVARSPFLSPTPPDAQYLPGWEPGDARTWSLRGPSSIP